MLFILLLYCPVRWRAARTGLTIFWRRMRTSRKIQRTIVKASQEDLHLCQLHSIALYWARSNVLPFRWLSSSSDKWPVQRSIYCHPQAWLGTLLDRVACMGCQVSFVQVSSHCFEHSCSFFSRSEQVQWPELSRRTSLTRVSCRLEFVNLFRLDAFATKMNFGFLFCPEPCRKRWTQNSGCDCSACVCTGRIVSGLYV